MADSHKTCEALVVGTGFAGLYAGHKLRATGLSAQGIEAAPDVGGIWTERFANRLSQAGVRVSHIRYGDVHHGFMNWVGLMDRSDEALATACNWLRTTVGGHSAAPRTCEKATTQ